MFTGMSNTKEQKGQVMGENTKRKMERPSLVAHSVVGSKAKGRNGIEQGKLIDGEAQPFVGFAYYTRAITPIVP